MVATARSECLDDNDVSEFVSGSLAKTAALRVESHLASCRDCRALVAALAADAAHDSNVATVPHEKFSPSQVTELPRKTLTVGDRVGRYLVLSTLGTGGMGVVFAAYDPQLDRKVALKLLRSGIQLPSKDAQKRLKREAQAIAQLSHPNVVGVYDVGTTDDGDLYIAMEFVEGDTLTTWLKAYPRTWREILDVFLQAGRGLVAAHGVGLLHRDFKPDNVLVGGDGRVRVTDFGLARSLLVPNESDRGQQTPMMPTALSSPLTATGTVLGTPRYMPPEQLMGPDIDARADQFSFCVALHEALYGQHPLPGGTSVSMLEKGDKALPPPDGTKVPVMLQRAVARGLEKERNKRFPTMASLIGELLPPPEPKVSRRGVAFLVGSVLAAGGAAAAMIVAKDEPRPLPQIQNGALDEIKDLKRQIDLLEIDRKRLIDMLDHKEKVDIEGLKQQLQEKDREIRRLVDEVEKIQIEGRRPTPAAAAPPSRRARVIASINAASPRIDNCLNEWLERARKIETPRGWETSDVDIVVGWHINADGRPYNVEARMRTSADKFCSNFEPGCNDSPSLRICIESAISSLKFPEGSEVLDVTADIGWSQGLQNVSGRVTGSHSPGTQKIDMDN
ncbi:MAG: protein kinase [Kofleriaceae bacterium]|nr:protein kinase [Kofleriaceae bacterium]